MKEADLKRKLREIKKLEIKLKVSSGCSSAAESGLVWSCFFDLGNGKGSKARYGLKTLLEMDKEQLASSIEEYFAALFYEIYRSNGLYMNCVFDPTLLAELGLGPDAGAEEARKRFRQLAMLHHPDKGGDSADFVRILDTYRKLTGNTR